jgi:hypothetical protein
MDFADSFRFFLGPRGVTSAARRGSFWLTLALVACAPTTKTISKGDGAGGDISSPPPGGTAGIGAGGTGSKGVPPTGGVAGIYVDGGTGGTSGIDTGGTSGTAGAVAGPTMNHAEWFDRNVRVVFDGSQGAWELVCGSTETSLIKANHRPFVDERPACGTPYYLDGRYDENVESEICYGCDYVACVPFPASKTFSVLEYVQNGVRPAPDDGAGGEAGAGGAPPDIADIYSHPYPGPYELTIRYYTDRTCERTGAIARSPVTFSLPDIGDAEGGASSGK